MRVAGEGGAKPFQYFLLPKNSFFGDIELTMTNKRIGIFYKRYFGWCQDRRK